MNNWRLPPESFAWYWEKFIYREFFLGNDIFFRDEKQFMSLSSPPIVPMQKSRRSVRRHVNEGRKNKRTMEFISKDFN